MNEQGITVLTDASLITCIVQRGRADKIVLCFRTFRTNWAWFEVRHGLGIRLLPECAFG
jgi:hypothetical protein